MSLFHRREANLYLIFYRTLRRPKRNTPRRNGMKRSDEGKKRAEGLAHCAGRHGVQRLLYYTLSALHYLGPFTLCTTYILLLNATEEDSTRRWLAISIVLTRDLSPFETSIGTVPREDPKRKTVVGNCILSGLQSG